MKSGILFLVCLLVLNGLAAIPAGAASRNLTVKTATQHQKRVALVIGNSAYQGITPLKNPVNDAKAMSNALNSLGFQVIEVTDATQKEMNRAIAAFGSKLNADTAALFFYAGHGLQVKGKNYLVPIDAQIGGESAVRAETVDVDTVFDQLNVSSLSIVILDACRNNPFERSFRSMGGGLAQIDAPKGSFISYATAPGKTASDGNGKNGLFTQELLKQINLPGLSLEAVFKRVRANVSRATGDTQMPWDSSSLTGDFYFKPAADGAPAASPPPESVRVQSAEEIEQEFWNQTKNSTEVEDFDAYLKQYPQGRYAALANAATKRIKRQTRLPSQGTGEAAELVEIWKSNDNQLFELRIKGSKVRLIRTSYPGDKLVFNVAWTKTPSIIIIPLEISGTLSGNQFTGEYVQTAQTTATTNCAIAPRRGKAEGTIDREAGVIRLVYDRTALEYEAEFESIMSNVFVCRITDQKEFPGYELELTP